MTRPGDDRRDEDAAAGCREPVEDEDRWFGPGRGTTGGTRSIRLCKPGTGMRTTEIAVEPRLDLRKAPAEHEDAQDDPRHPRADDVGRRMGRRRLAAAFSRSPGSSQIARGFQHLEKQHDRADRGRPTPRRPPATVRESSRRGTAGWRTRRRRRESPARPPSMPRAPANAQTSQNGTITEKKGSWRPTMALSVVQIQRRDRLQREDRRPERAECDRARCWRSATVRRRRAERSRGRSEWRPVTATGVPNPDAPSKNAPKQNATSSNCSRRSRVTVVMLPRKIANSPRSLVS